MAASVAVGPTTATVGSEVQLGSTIAVWGTYVVYLDLINLAAGDIVELRVYDRIPAGSGTERLAQGPVSYGPVVPEEKIVASIPVVTTYFRATVKQLTGTARSFPWEIRSA
jgi:hypothetical protein